MQLIHILYVYTSDKWIVDETPQAMLVSELLSKSAYFHLIVEDLNGKHSLNRKHLDNSLSTDTLQQAISKLVFNSPITYATMTSGGLEDIPNIKLKNGVVTIPNVNPLVFNTTTSFLTKPYNGGSLVIDYLDNVEATNDVTLGCFSNLTNFEAIQLSKLNTIQFDASLLKINNVLVKTTDYFKNLGNDVIIKPHKVEALMSLLVEARLSPRDIGIVGNYTKNSFMSRLVSSRLIKHPDVIALVNPALEPVELRRYVLPKSLALPTDDVIFVGNRPTTNKALTVLPTKETSPNSATSSGVVLELQGESLHLWHQVRAVYPRLYFAKVF
jgi:hypothetical protein